MPGDDAPEPLSSSDFHKFMESFKTSIGETILTAIAPVQAMQKEIIVDLTKTKDRVTAIEEDNDSTKAKVEELQKQMTSLQQNLSDRQTQGSSNSHLSVGSALTFRPSPPPPPPTVVPPPVFLRLMLFKSSEMPKESLAFHPSRLKTSTT